MDKKIGLFVALLCASWMVSCGDSSNNSSREGEACDTKSFELSCEGDNLLYCSQNVINIQNCTAFTARDGNTETCVSFNRSDNSDICDEDDESCASDLLNKYDAVSCISVAEQCTVENDVQVRCEKAASGMTYLRSYKCERTLDGRLFYHRVSSEKCYDGYGVCSSNGECTEPVACEDGYVTHCDGNTLYKCNKNRLLSSDCTSYSTPHTCSIIDDTPQCLDPKKACDKEGDEIVTSCIVKSGKEQISVCMRAENGNLYYQSAGARNCLSGCNEEGTACKVDTCSETYTVRHKCRIQGTSTTYIDTYTCTEKNGEKVYVLSASDKCDEGHGTCSEDDQCVPAEDCVASSFESRCTDGAAVNCTSKKVRYNHCELSSNSPICAVVNDKASCFSESDRCQDEGNEIVTRCNANTNKEIIKKCMAGSDGYLYYVSGGSRACANGCNAEGTACAE